MTDQGTDGLLCTAAVNPLWPHRHEQTAEVTANPSIKPGYDTCGMTESGHAEYTADRIRSAEWGQACYQRAAENDVRKGIPLNLAHAEQELIDDAHADALKEEFGEDYYTEADWIENIDAALDDAAGVRSAIDETDDPDRIEALHAEARSLDRMAAYSENKLAELRVRSRHEHSDSDEF